MRWVRSVTKTPRLPLQHSLEVWKTFPGLPRQVSVNASFVPQIDSWLHPEWEGLVVWVWILWLSPALSFCSTNQRHCRFMFRLRGIPLKTFTTQAKPCQGNSITQFDGSSSTYLNEARSSAIMLIFSVWNSKHERTKGSSVRVDSSLAGTLALVLWCSPIRIRG